MSLSTNTDLIIHEDESIFDITSEQYLPYLKLIFNNIFTDIEYKDNKLYIKFNNINIKFIYSEYYQLEMMDDCDDEYIKQIIDKINKEIIENKLNQLEDIINIINNNFINIEEILQENINKKLIEEIQTINMNYDNLHIHEEEDQYNLNIDIYELKNNELLNKYIKENESINLNITIIKDKFPNIIYILQLKNIILLGIETIILENKLINTSLIDIIDNLLKIIDVKEDIIVKDENTKLFNSIFLLEQFLYINNELKDNNIKYFTLVLERSLQLNNDNLVITDKLDQILDSIVALNNENLTDIVTRIRKYHVII